MDRSQPPSGRRGPPVGMLTQLVAFKQLLDVASAGCPGGGAEVRNGIAVPTFREMLAEAKAAVREIEPAEAEQEIAAGDSVVLDVREPDEYEQGALSGAVHIPRGTLETSVEGRIPDKSSHVVVYCAGGTRSAFAAQTMQELGYRDVASVIGGFNRWKDEGREWVTPRALSPEQ